MDRAWQALNGNAAATAINDTKIVRIVCGRSIVMVDCMQDHINKRISTLLTIMPTGIHKTAVKESLARPKATQRKQKKKNLEKIENLSVVVLFVSDFIH